MSSCFNYVCLVTMHLKHLDIITSTRSASLAFCRIITLSLRGPFHSVVKIKWLRHLCCCMDWLYYELFILPSLVNRYVYTVLCHYDGVQYNMIFHTVCSDLGITLIRLVVTKDAPYLTLTLSVVRIFLENWMHQNGTALYIEVLGLYPNISISQIPLNSPWAYVYALRCPTVFPLGPRDITSDRDKFYINWALLPSCQLWLEHLSLTVLAIIIPSKLGQYDGPWWPGDSSL